MVPFFLVVLATSFTIAPAVTPEVSFAATRASETAPEKQNEPGRGDDLSRIQQWRTFLDRAVRAFTAAKMSTTEVKAKVEEADRRIEELQDDGSKATVGRSDITGDVSFLERAFRAFTAAKMSTTDVKRWLEEARDGGEAG
jgi:hypothetical protein